MDILSKEQKKVNVENIEIATIIKKNKGVERKGAVTKAVLHKKRRQKTPPLNNLFYSTLNGSFCLCLFIEHCALYLLFLLSCNCRKRGKRYQNEQRRESVTTLALVKMMMSAATAAGFGLEAFEFDNNQRVVPCCRVAAVFDQENSRCSINNS